MRVIIVGANGFVGSNLVNKFVDNNIEVLAIDISFTKINFKQSNLVSIIESDMMDIEKLQKKIGIIKYDLFYNLAWKGVNGPDKAQYDVQISNILISMKCAELAKRLGCEKYLCAGTIAERAVESIPMLDKTNPGLMYAVAKQCCHTMLENYCKSIKLNFVWMQFSNIFGPSNRTGNLIGYTLSQLFKSEEATFGPARQPYDFIFSEDLIEAVFRLGVIDVPQNFYFIGSGSPEFLYKYLEKVGLIFGRSDLIKIGHREDDGIHYSFEMFDTSSLVKAIGKYVNDSFEDNIKKTIDSMGD